MRGRGRGDVIEPRSSDHGMAAHDDRSALFEDNEAYQSATGECSQTAGIRIDQRAVILRGADVNTEACGFGGAVSRLQRTFRLYKVVSNLQLTVGSSPFYDRTRRVQQRLGGVVDFA